MLNQCLSENEYSFQVIFFRNFQLSTHMQTCLTGLSTCIIMFVDAESRILNVIVHIVLFTVSGVASKVSSRHVNVIMQQM
jgi:hypothetical protein